MGSAIRGSRVGAGPMGEAERGDAADRVKLRLVVHFRDHRHQVHVRRQVCVRGLGFGVLGLGVMRTLGTLSGPSSSYPSTSNP